MSDDLSAPLAGRRRRTPPKPPPEKTRSRLGELPLARIGFGLMAIVIVGLAARVFFVNDPMGGQPIAEIDVSGSRNTNAVVDTVAGASMATITAEPETPAGGPGIVVVGDEIPAGTIAADEMSADAAGLFPELLEETEHGPIPRISESGQRPFQAYARPSITPATAEGKKLIAIIVTGLGLNKNGTQSAIDNLPESITLAFAPYGSDLPRTVALARADGHEVLLQVPLEPFDYPESDPGPDTLLTGQAPRDNMQKLFTVMASFGGYVGLINHMGARFTASTADFAPMMEELGTRGLGYLDDGTSNRSLSQQLALANDVEYGRADMVLDLVPSRDSILEQLGALEAKAIEKGAAIGVISALPISVQTLTEWSKTAADQGFAIVPVTALMRNGA